MLFQYKVPRGEQVCVSVLVLHHPYGWFVGFLHSLIIELSLIGLIIPFLSTPSDLLCMWVIHTGGA
uniref:Uncharacterized protein n=1 Tax=Anguilla anguilla TaxID=7936 RepID=A0A0E9XIC0_ANGAN